MFKVMKKMTFLACATLLTSAVALNSCKSDEPGGNPNLNDGDVVKTEFAISLPDNVAGGPNKMPAATVINETSQFAGINDIILVPFAKQGKLTGSETRLGKNIRLSTGVAPADLTKPSKAKVYENVDVPLTTASFLFYGVSAATGSKFQVGSLIADTASAPNNTANEFGFALEQIKSDYASTLTSGHGKSLLDYLSSVANAQDTMASGSKKWSEYPNVGDSVAYFKLFQAYTSLTDLSSFQVERLLTDLYQSLQPFYESSAIAKGIIKAIKNGTYASISNDSVKLITDLNNYPQEFNLPAGCISIKWNGSNAFVAGDYVANRATPDNFVYPAKLWFFANSTIKTANKSMKNLYDNDAEHTWAYILNQHNAGLAVNSLTRAVALYDSVQFAVARFDVQVRLKDSTHLEDNSKTVEGIAKGVPIPAGGIPVTAVFVGGQKDVDFKFQPTGATERTIYDNAMASKEAASPADMVAKRNVYSALNHTLVLETAASTNIRVAVEMENNTGVDFYGAGGQLIPRNSKFYVVGELKYDVAGTGGEIKAAMEDKVFKQDYTTTARLTLKNLQNAYNTIPDLRTPKLEIGFAVDLTWQGGNTYVIDFE